jgi:hypothetical protein
MKILRNYFKKIVIETDAFYPSNPFLEKYTQFLNVKIQINFYTGQFSL